MKRKLKLNKSQQSLVSFNNYIYFCLFDVPGMDPTSLPDDFYLESLDNSFCFYIMGLSVDLYPVAPCPPPTTPLAQTQRSGSTRPIPLPHLGEEEGVAMMAMSDTDEDFVEIDISFDVLHYPDDNDME